MESNSHGLINAQLLGCALPLSCLLWLLQCSGRLLMDTIPLCTFLALWLLLPDEIFWS